MLEADDEKVVTYRDFDLCDREYTECRMRLSERLRAIEKESLKERYFVRRENKPPKSIASEKSRVPMSRRLDAAAQAAKLKVEMKFLEQETNVR